jgi:hypothetical protein
MVDRHGGDSRSGAAEAVMATLRVDPWDPQYGASIEIDEDWALPPALELDVEGIQWEPVKGAQIDSLPCCAFVDGARRVDVRLFAEEGDHAAPALAGSWAVGVAWSTLPPQIGEVIVGRELVIGGGLSSEDLIVTIGNQELRYRFAGVAGASPLEPIQGLQNQMRLAEAELARLTTIGRKADVLVLDGPLTYFSTAPAIGLVKRQSRSYLDGNHAGLLGQLRRGERTPIFAFGEQRLERYSWYLRLVEGRAIDGVMAGIVRLEVTTEIGLEGARELADLSAAVLPRFSSVPGRDPRAPQNLYPVGHLELILRHRLADAELVRRAVEQRLMEAYV